MITYGPKVTVRRDCTPCPACASHHYKCQGDSGFDVSCSHPALPEPKRIGDSTWETPEWCPALAAQAQAKEGAE